MSESDPDMLAAEYVLGTLEAGERERARHLVATDPAFAEAVRAWEQRLSPLSRLAPAAEPPAGLWARIDARTAPPASLEAARIRRALRRWQAATAAAVALAAAFAGLAFLRAPPAPRVVALSTASKASMLLAVDGVGGALSFRPAAPLAAPPAGRDYELWALPEGAKVPRPLGVLPPAGMRLSSSLPPGTQIMVSVEPKGGSPTGLPTGPVIYAGVLRMVAE